MSNLVVYEGKTYISDRAAVDEDGGTVNRYLLNCTLKLLLMHSGQLSLL